MEARAPTLADRVENVRRSLAALPPDADAAQLLHVRLAELERFAHGSLAGVRESRADEEQPPPPEHEIPRRSQEEATHAAHRQGHPRK